MSKAENRLQLMDRLGAVQLNHVWSWCAVNETERKVYFSIWTDKRDRSTGPRSYVLQEPHWGVDERTGAYSAARVDHDAKFELVFEKSYEPLGYFIEAKDPKGFPREIDHTVTSFVVTLKLSRNDNGDIIGTLLNRIELP
jgi:hypothetical protein